MPTLLLILLNAAYEETEPGYALAVFFIIGLIVWSVYAQYRRDLKKEFGDKLKTLSLKDISVIMSQAEEFLLLHFPYYNALSVRGKDRFKGRIHHLLGQKQFVGKQGLLLEPEMLIMTSGGIVQLTFGLQEFELPKFSRIELYPDSFLDITGRRTFNGSMHQSGIIRLSWKHIQRGFSITDDGVNLALHEFGHALKFSLEKDTKVDRGLYKGLQLFKHEGERIMERVISGQLELIRKYAGTNEHEFFACCIEVFFENPKEFKLTLPDLYAALAELLAQDTNNHSEDFKLKGNLRSPTSAERIKKLALPGPDRDFNYIHTMMLIGFALWMFVVLLYAIVFTSDIEVKLLFLATIVVVGVLFFYRRLLKTGYTSTYTFMMFILMGWLPTSALVAGVLNLLIPVYLITSDTQIIGHHNGKYFNYGLEHPVPDPAKKAYILNESQKEELKSGKVNYYVRVHEYYGLFALKVFDHAELLRVQVERPLE